MAVFVSASDEGSGANHLCQFEVTGWLAPEDDWSRFFAPAWQSRVLDGPPRIPYLHVTEIRSKKFREKYGLTQLAADNRLDEAASVIGAMGSLYPVRIALDGGLFRQVFASHKLLAVTGGIKRYEPDYYAFMTYAYAVLCRVQIRHPEAEKVDFIVENKAGITKHLSGFYDSLPNALRHIGREDLIHLVGEFIPGSKERVPLQAADFLCWHTQRADAQTLTLQDWRRWVPMANKKGFSFAVTRDLLTGLADAFKEHGEKQGAANERTIRVRQLRQNNARSDESSTRRDKGRTRRGKGRNNKKKAKG
ncbi:MAG TPA: DUF3800 domain-containing protein [Candidatus Sulfotelmatobacter sp.]|jgi:hypothetical protein